MVCAWLHDAANLQNFTINIIPNKNYNVFCSLILTAPTDGKYSDIFIATNPGPTFHAILFHAPPPDQLATLKTQVRISRFALYPSSSRCQSIHWHQAPKLKLSILGP
jgi:hypothetical protein